MIKKTMVSVDDLHIAAQWLEAYDPEHYVESAACHRG